MSSVYILSMGDPSTHQPQPEPQVDPSDSKRRGIPGWFLWFLLALVLYPLSTGPVRKLEEKGLIRSAVPGTIYAPIDTFCFAHWPARRCYVAYLRLWHIHGVRGPTANGITVWYIVEP
jgi:hypothetical protein